MILIRLFIDEVFAVAIMNEIVIIIDAGFFNAISKDAFIIDLYGMIILNSFLVMKAACSFGCVARLSS